MLSERGAVLEPSELLDMCDGALGEVGRRSHLFSWLRRDGGDGQGWLPVDSYYPRHRLVVICSDGREHDGLYRELIPRHGLALLVLSPAELGGDRPRVREIVRQRVAAIAPPPPPPPPDPEPRARRAHPARAPVLAQAAAALASPAAQSEDGPRIIGPSQAAAIARAARLASSRSTAARPRRQPQAVQLRPRQSAARPPRPRQQGGDLEALGLFLGVFLVALLLVEMYLDVTKLALDAGQVLLSFGIAIDAVARALGTIAARRTGAPGWAWACAIAGSPAVMAFALFQDEGPIAADPAPLAGLLSLLACGVIAIGVLAAVL